jgi:DNA-binding MarR family transcriptional regulator
LCQPLPAPTAATMITPPLDDDLAAVSDQVTAGLQALGLALRSRAWRDATPLGLTATQAQVLTLLHAAGAPLRVSGVAERLGVTLPTASDAVTAMVAKGLVAKARAADDARAVVLTLTDAGREVLREIDRTPAFLADAVRAMPEAMQGSFLRGLVTLVRALQVRGDIAPLRTCVSCRFFEANAHPGSDAPHHCHFVQAPFGDRALRLECTDQQPGEASALALQWERFVAGAPRVRRSRGAASA